MLTFPLSLRQSYYVLIGILLSLFQRDSFVVWYERITAATMPKPVCTPGPRRKAFVLSADIEWHEHQDHLAVDVKIIFKQKFQKFNPEKFKMPRCDKIIILFVRTNDDYGCSSKLNNDCNGWIKVMNFLSFFFFFFFFLFLLFFCFIRIHFYVHSPRMEENMHFIWCDEWMIWRTWSIPNWPRKRAWRPFRRQRSLAFHYITLSFIGIGGEKHLRSEIKRRIYYLDVYLVCCLQLNSVLSFSFSFSFLRDLFETRAFII